MAAFNGLAKGKIARIARRSSGEPALLVYNGSALAQHVLHAGVDVAAAAAAKAALPQLEMAKGGFSSVPRAWRRPSR